MKDVYISYAGADEAWAVWIGQALESRGLTVVLDLWDFLPGENRVLRSQEALEECSRVLVLLSPAYLEDPFGQAEWTVKFLGDPAGRHRTVIPFVLHSCRIPPLLASRIAVYRGIKSAAALIQELYNAVTGRSGRPTAPVAFPRDAGAAPSPVLEGLVPRYGQPVRLSVESEGRAVEDADIPSVPDVELPADQPVRVLFLASSPLDHAPLRQGSEYQRIAECLAWPQVTKRFELECVWEVTPDRFPGVLVKHRPAIVHFSGHGSPDGRLMFDSLAGVGRGVEPSVLGEIFAAVNREARDPIRCVFLNACYSRGAAAAIVHYVDAVIGTDHPVGDRVAAAFAQGFYLGIADGRTMAGAFVLGRACASLIHPDEAGYFVLNRRSDAAPVRR